MKGVCGPLAVAVVVLVPGLVCAVPWPIVLPGEVVVVPSSCGWVECPVESVIRHFVSRHWCPGTWLPTGLLHFLSLASFALGVSPSLSHCVSWRLHLCFFPAGFYGPSFPCAQLALRGSGAPGLLPVGMFLEF